LMEALNQGYLDIMAMPIGRRKRFIDEKEHLEKMRAARRKQK